jgi:holo-[acyl-carrier protein] synthase
MKLIPRKPDEHMVHGIGVDIIEIDRIREMVDRYGNRFLMKVFTETEVNYCRSKKIPYQHFAARYAAKEAFSKAIATGWRGEFRWRDVEVSNNEFGQPSITLYGKLADRIGTDNVMISLSHSDNVVVAFVVIEKRNL